MSGELTARNLTKRYGAVTALDNVSVQFQPNQIHAVVGENGAGKSTLIGILAGFVEPSAGEVLLDGRSLPLGRPFDCRRLGIGMVHQHFTLVQELTVEENLALSQIESVYGRLNKAQLTKRPLETAERLGWRMDPTARIEDLPVGVQQRVEILKALAIDANVLIFDEPTAVLSPQEAEDLLQVLRDLREQGKTVILIAHKLKEVLSVADHITVLRRGSVVASLPAAEADEVRLAGWMVGELPANLVKKAMAKASALSVRDLQVKGDRGNIAVNAVTFEIGSGEVLGIGGVDGNGQVELAEALAGVRSIVAGKLEWKGESLPKSLVVGYVPQDRQHEGLALRMSVQENLMIQSSSAAGQGPFLSARRTSEWAQGIVHRFSIKAASLADPVGGLSGGNQQKVVVGRVLDAKPELLIAVNPTRGLDVRATDFVHRQIAAAKEAGAAVALFSTDLDELAAVADRTLFMSGGRLHASEGAASLVGG